MYLLDGFSFIDYVRLSVINFGKLLTRLFTTYKWTFVFAVSHFLKMTKKGAEWKTKIKVFGLAFVIFMIGLLTEFDIDIEYFFDCALLFCEI